MKWVKLTAVYAVTGKQTEWMVNMAQVRGYNWDKTKLHTVLVFANGDVLNVEEPPAEILKLTQSGPFS